MNDLCIYHGNCADGFGAAWAVRNCLGTWKVDYHPGVYQEDPPDVEGRRVILVDFSYKKPVIEEMAKKAKSILIIDHHKSAQDDLKDYPEPPADIPDLKGWLPESGVYAKFDMTKSGAILAWEHFNYGLPPKLLLHIQDRDLWQFKLEGTREIQANVFSYPYEMDVWDELMGTELESMRSDGAAIERKHFKDIDELLKVCERSMVIGGFTVPVASLPYTLVSDAAHKMAIGSPFAACYWDTQESRIFGLRSVEGGEDVSAIAKQYGGGGHEHSAGFSVPREHELAIA